MTAPEFDPITAAEYGAQGWADNYVGKRRAVPDEAIRDLVAARVAEWLGDKAGQDHALAEAYRRLYAQGHTWVSANRAIRKANRSIDVEAQAQLFGLQLDQVSTPDDILPSRCLDPVLHAEWDRRAGQTEASRMRIAHGCCGWCGKTVRRSRG